MRKKHAKIVVKTLGNVKSEWKEAMKGKKRSLQKEEDLIFTSLEAVAKVFSKTRMEILRTIIREKPKSIYELAKQLGRDFKNVYSDIQLLTEIGLVELKESGSSRSGLIPISRFSGIDLDLAA